MGKPKLLPLRAWQDLLLITCHLEARRLPGIWVCAHVSRHLCCTAGPAHLGGQGLVRLHGSMACLGQEMLWLDKEACCWLGLQLDMPSAARAAASSSGSHGIADGGRLLLNSTAACTAAHHELKLCGRLYPCLQGGLPLPAGCNLQVAPSLHKALAPLAGSLPGGH